MVRLRYEPSLATTSFESPDIDVVQFEVVLADRREVLPAEHGNGALLVGDGGHAPEQLALGIEELPTVAGRADDIDPQFAVGRNEDLVDERFPFRPIVAPGVAGGARPPLPSCFEFSTSGSPFLVRDRLGRQCPFDDTQGKSPPLPYTAIR